MYEFVKFNQPVTMEERIAILQDHLLEKFSELGKDEEGVEGGERGEGREGEGKEGEGEEREKEAGGENEGKKSKREEEVLKGSSPSLALSQLLSTYPVKIYVDSMENVAEKAYSAWPERLYVISSDRKTVLYRGETGPEGYRVDLLELFLSDLFSNQTARQEIYQEAERINS